MKRVLIFLAGAAVGSLVTWKIVETQYNKMIDEEIEAYKEHMTKKAQDMGLIKEKEITLEGKTEQPNYYPHRSGPYPWGSEEQKEYEELVDDYTVETDPLKERTAPYIISPEEFGEFGNETKSLTYYADGILADDDDIIVDDCENVIGDALDHFGEYEDDAIHVRDENIECDYEILRSEKTFSEIIKEDD